MLLGVTGKSAQIPLFVWLPDAMAGPTPVSALIHAATMVTAGVYLMVRANVFLWELNHAGYVLGLIITLVGAGTAIIAGYIALGQWDIKRVLGLLDHFAAGLHGGGGGHRRLCSGDVPFGHPCGLQGAALPRQRLGNPRR